MDQELWFVIPKTLSEFRALPTPRSILSCLDIMIPGTETPITLPQLFAYVASSPPYHNTNHVADRFPELADFLQHELKSALYYGISTFKALKTELEEAVIEALQQPGSEDHVRVPPFHNLLLITHLFLFRSIL